MVERLVRIQEVRGSIPLISTKANIVRTLCVQTMFAFS